MENISKIKIKKKRNKKVTNYSGVFFVISYVPILMATSFVYSLFYQYGCLQKLIFFIFLIINFFIFTFSIFNPLIRVFISKLLFIFYLIVFALSLYEIVNTSNLNNTIYSILWSYYIRVIFIIAPLFIYSSFMSWRGLTKIRQ